MVQSFRYNLVHTVDCTKNYYPCQVEFLVSSMYKIVNERSSPGCKNCDLFLEPQYHTRCDKEVTETHMKLVTDLLSQSKPENNFR